MPVCAQGPRQDVEQDRGLTAMIPPAPRAPALGEGDRPVEVERNLPAADYPPGSRWRATNAGAWVRRCRFNFARMLLT